MKRPRVKENHTPVEISVSLKVTDDWHPNFPGNKVRARVVCREFGGVKFVRLCAWGMDDTGMQRDWYYTTDEDRVQYLAAAFNELEKLVRNQPVNRQALEASGLTYA